MISSAIVIAVSVVVILATTAFSLRSQLPFWMVFIVCLVTYPLSTQLLQTPAFADAGRGFAGEWAVRLAVISTATAVLGLFSGRKARAGGGGPERQAS
ncbi:hypothetical protein ACI2L1_43735 [Streptomyces sp. NPDC019531]|uniref:hypothetical protein n=1 Tax=Streptomyces sp. NPDC019531 TaxID=3365062 RepID=UPI0038504197